MHAPGTIGPKPGPSIAFTAANLGGVASDEGKESGVFIEVPMMLAPSLGMPIINQQTARPLSSSQASSYVESPDVARGKTFAIMQGQVGEDFCEVEVVFRVHAVVGWEWGVGTIFISVK